MKIRLAFLFLALLLMGGCSFPWGKFGAGKDAGQESCGDPSGKKVEVKVFPGFDFRYDTMRPGVLQHLDRAYTYDVVPPELTGGLLFQGIHRPPKGTALEIRLFCPGTIYFFFHDPEDGGYSRIFQTLKGWKRSKVFPQYDIHNGNHGLKMVMYERTVQPGTYSIPPTTKDRACFNMVFKFRLWVSLAAPRVFQGSEE